MHKENVNRANNANLSELGGRESSAGQREEPFWPAEILPKVSSAGQSKSGQRASNERTAVAQCRMANENENENEDDQ